MLNQLEQLEQIEEAAESEDRIKRAYRRQLTGELGELVLIDMLFELHFLRPCDNEAEQALCNYAKKLISTIYGVEVRQSRLLALISKLKKEEPKQSKYKELLRKLLRKDL